ncbi:MAG: substrate-binding domain-containing protein [Spirochaetaceae bacterium]|nr:substrate-binding domain-containing protein [Spirochaetaceae bacterium]
MKKRIILLLLILSILFIIAFSETKNKNNKSETPYRIAFIRMKEGGQFWASMRNGARDARTATSSVLDFYSTMETLDINEQIKYINQAINDNVDGIVITPCDNEQLVAPLEKASSMGIKIIQLYNEVNYSDKINSIKLMSNTLNMGHDIANFYVNDYKEVVRNALIIANTNHITSSNYMIDGISRVFKSEKIKYNVLYLTGDSNNSQYQLKVYLESHSEVDSILALDDYCSECSVYVTPLFNKDYYIMATGHSLLNIQNLDNGNIDSILVVNSYAMGYQSVIGMVAILNTQKFSKTKLDYIFVTRENMFDENVQKELFSLL